MSGLKSSVQKCKLGVPQGSILGPLLFFCLYVNDLPESCKEVGCQLYVDDTIYLTAETSHLAAEMLTRQMVSVSQWLRITVELKIIRKQFLCAFRKESATKLT